MSTYLDSALSASFRRRVQTVGGVDIVVGVPAYKNSRTISEVIHTVAAGLHTHFPGVRSAIVVADGGATDETLKLSHTASLAPGVKLLVSDYVGLTGKGSAVRGILEASEVLEASACAIVDADLRTITPQWVERLVAPILRDEADFVTPYYTRDRHEVTINDLITYPFTRGLYGRGVRHPLGAEMAMGPRAWKAFIARDVWETDVARFGIHIWMVTQAVNSGWRLAQAALGTKTHDYKDPTVGFEPKFMQIIGTMFRLMSIYRRVWPEVHGAEEVPVYGEVKRVEADPVPATRQSLWDGFTKGFKRYRRNLQAILDPAQFDLVRDLASGEATEWPAGAWARTVMDFAVVYNRGEGDPDKVALSLLPLYYARKAMLLRELEGQLWSKVEDSVQAEADSFIQAKRYLVDRWESYLPWQGAGR